MGDSVMTGATTDEDSPESSQRDFLTGDSSSASRERFLDFFFFFSLIVAEDNEMGEEFELCWLSFFCFLQD